MAENAATPPVGNVRDPRLISPREVRGLLVRGEPVTVLDARGRAAYARSEERVAGDLRAESRGLPEIIPTLDRDAWLIAYCT